MSTLTITTIQTNLHWEDKAANLAMFKEKINSIGQRTELVLLPEMFSTGFSMQPQKLAETMEGPTIEWMSDIATEKNIILAGSVIIEEEGHYYNRLVWMLPTGKFGIYDKRHRFAFAGEDEQYTAGSKRLIASVKGWKINLQVCYDLRFPVWARQTPPHTQDHEPGDEAEYDMLVYVANWPERRKHAWKTLLQARAIENQCYVIGVNRTGDDGNKIHHSGGTMIVDAMGEALYYKEDEEEVFTITLSKESLNEIRSKLPFLKDGDGFMLLQEE